MRCTRYKRVRSKYGGTVRRCANFSGSPRSRSGKSRRRKRGKRPFNKGRRCVDFGTRLSPTGRPMRYCRSYGASPAWRQRTGRGQVVSTRLPGWIPRGVRVGKPAPEPAIRFPSGSLPWEGLGAMLLPVRGARSTRYRGRYGR